MSAVPGDGADEAVVPTLGVVVKLAGENAMNITAQYPSGTVHYIEFSETKPAAAPYYEAYDIEDAQCGEYDTISKAVAAQLGRTISANNHEWTSPDDEVFISACVWKDLTDLEKTAVRALVARVYVPDYNTVSPLYM